MVQSAEPSSVGSVNCACVPGPRSPVPRPPAGERHGGFIRRELRLLGAGFVALLSAWFRPTRHSPAEILAAGMCVAG